MPASLAYEPGPSPDEAFARDGSVRELYRQLLDELAERDLGALERAVNDTAEQEGVVFGGVGEERAFRLDPVPRLIGAAEWASTSAGLVQRARALTAFLADAYGEARIVSAGRVPERVIESAVYYEPLARGLELRHDGFLAGLDLVRDLDGSLAVLEDNTRTPSGLGYAIGARKAVDAELAGLAPAGRLDVQEGYAMVAAALRASAPDGVDDPHVVLLSDGPGNSAWHEHQQYAAHMDVPLVTPGDLAVRDGRLHARLGGERSRPVDVVYRRTDEDRLSDEQGRPTWLAELLLPPAREGTLTVVNPLGSGLADDKLVHAYVEDMVRFYLDEEPLLRSVTTYDLGDPDGLSDAMERIGELVVKPRDGYGGIGVVLCRECSAGELAEVESRVRADPGSFVAQELVSISTHPTVIDGRLAPRHVDLRPFVVGGGHASTTVPGGLSRVAFGAGEMVVNSSRDGGGKDTWVMG